MRQVRNIIYRGSTAKVNLAMDQPARVCGSDFGRTADRPIRISPSLDYLERAYDARQVRTVFESAVFGNGHPDTP